MGARALADLFNNLQDDGALATLKALSRLGIAIYDYTNQSWVFHERRVGQEELQQAIERELRRR